jgi:hypothetical protein
MYRPNNNVKGAEREILIEVFILWKTINGTIQVTNRKF